MDERPLKILVIGLCPLGNWVMATGAFQDIRHYYPRATIYHLVPLSFAPTAREQGCFDHLLTTRWWDPPYDFAAMNLNEVIEILFFKQVWRNRIRQMNFDILFDLRGTKKVRRLYQDLPPGPKIFTLGQERSAMTTVYEELLRKAGVTIQSQPRLKWSAPFEQAIFDCQIIAPFCVLIPRSLFEQSRKNWPVSRFQALASLLQKQGLTPVIIGSKRDLIPLKSLRLMAGNVDLVNKTPLYALPGLFASASLVVGVDTGTTHLSAVVGASTVALYGPSSLETWGIRGPQVSWVKKNKMDEISVEDVWQACLSFARRTSMMKTE